MNAVRVMHPGRALGAKGSRRMMASALPLPVQQAGALTLFTAVLVLVLMTLMLLYATRVSQLETRMSANDLRQKIAFHAAETALDQGMMYLEANGERVLSTAVDAFPEPLGGKKDEIVMTGDGWLAPGSERWVACDASDEPAVCGYIRSAGEFGVEGTFYIHDADTATGAIDSMITVQGVENQSAARSSALMCVIDRSAPLLDADGDMICLDDSGFGSVEGDDLVPVLWVMGYGFSDCSGADNPSVNCTGYAAVTRAMSSYTELARPPSVPWTSKSVWPPSGNATVVGNPNAGGVGLTGTVWANCNDYDPCVEGDKGSWQTCELHEWYGYQHGERPEGVACPKGPSCDCNNKDAQLSNSNNINIDIIQDPLFPDDLFYEFFGVHREDYLDVKNSALPLLEDCDTLDEYSSGLYWTSNSCKFNQNGGNKVIGSPENPVILVAAGPEIAMAGTVDFFGILYIFDGENPDAFMSGNGTFRLYGAGVADIGVNCPPGDERCATKHFNGNFHVVYNEGVLIKSGGIAGFGAISGGWRDFGVPEIAW